MDNARDLFLHIRQKNFGSTLSFSVVDSVLFLYIRQENLSSALNSFPVVELSRIGLISG